jgi:UDP-N-acetylmuramoylalanine--D-glutamate ligase
MIANNNQQQKLVEPVAVLGVGVEGRATIDYLLSLGLDNITALDRNIIEGLPEKISTIWGDDHLEGLDRFATIFRSPGIRPDHPALVHARNSGALVTSAISYFLEHCPATVLGVTGTVGKGTTASLIARLLEAAGFRVFLGGNIGSSPLVFLNEVEPNDKVVLEISSFQAMDVTTSPEVAVVLKTTSEHLDWHTDLDEYRAAKRNLLSFQSADDIVIYNGEVDGSAQVAISKAETRMAYALNTEVESGLWRDGKQTFLRRYGVDQLLPFSIDRARLRGSFNLENIYAGILAALSQGADVNSICPAAERFEGLPHRLEFVTEGRGIQFYNDSYATRPEAALGALSCFYNEPLGLILGGSEKHADFGELASAIWAHPTIVHVALIGATAQRLHEAIGKIGPQGFTMAIYDDLEPAMEDVTKTLVDSGAVLLAPACASFGLFANYKVRGERFRAKAKELAAMLRNQ